MELKLLTLVGLANVSIAVDGVPEGGFRGKRLSYRVSGRMNCNNTYDTMKLLTSIGLANVGITANGVLDEVFWGKRWSK